MLPEQKKLLDAVAEMRPEMQTDNLSQDQAATAPREIFRLLCSFGLLSATLPPELGGSGFGYGSAGASALCRLLGLLGEGSLPVARLYEAHMNALQLVIRYGRPSLVSRVAEDVLKGHLFALWVTDPPDGGGVRLVNSERGLSLVGNKAFCSGSGFATRALVTADTPTGTQMLILNLKHDARVMPCPVRLAGMRAAATGSMGFSGMQINEATILGNEGDYLREPVFSAGAWRGSAAALGALKSLVTLHRQGIEKRKRNGNPYQSMRFGQLIIAYETSRLWVEKAALRACLEDAPPEAIVAYVNVARLAVERACLDAMRLTQRSLGLSAFVAGDRVEILCRDLATYLRQPAPDEALETAASFYFKTGIEDL